MNSADQITDEMREKNDLILYARYDQENNMPLTVLHLKSGQEITLDPQHSVSLIGALINTMVMSDVNAFWVSHAISQGRDAQEALAEITHLREERGKAAQALFQQQQEEQHAAMMAQLAQQFGGDALQATGEQVIEGVVSSDEETPSA